MCFQVWHLLLYLSGDIISTVQNNTP